MKTTCGTVTTEVTVLDEVTYVMETVVTGVVTAATLVLTAEDETAATEVAATEVATEEATAEVTVPVTVMVEPETVIVEVPTL